MRRHLRLHCQVRCQPVSAPGPGWGWRGSLIMRRGLRKRTGGQQVGRRRSLQSVQLRAEGTSQVGAVA